MVAAPLDFSLTVPGTKSEIWNANLPAPAATYEVGAAPVTNV